MNLENKTVFITGGTSGYGKAAAKMLTEHGASVIIAARNSPLDVPMPSSKVKCILLHFMCSASKSNQYSILSASVFREVRFVRSKKA